MHSLEAYRAFFPVTENLSYLNHAGVAPISTRVFEAIRGATQECLEWGAARYDGLVQGVESVRRSAARFLNAGPEEIAFVKNTSEGISFVAQGFGWKPGDVVVVPEGEFPSNVYPWMNLARRGVHVARVPMRDGRLLLDDFRRALDAPGVQVLAVSSVEFETGFRNDLSALGQICKERGILFFVDAIQSLGCLPLDPRSLGIHALAADAHKWLLGPEGIGILWVSRDAWDRLDPVEVGWKSVVEAREFSRICFQLRTDALKFESGSQAIIPIRGLGASIDLLLEVGVERIEQAVRSTIDALVDGLGRRGYRILSSLEPSERSGILAFVSRRSPVALTQELLKAGVFAAARGEGVRVSPHFYNSWGDVERFFAALDALDQ